MNRLDVHPRTLAFAAALIGASATLGSVARAQANAKPDEPPAPAAQPAAPPTPPPPTPPQPSETAGPTIIFGGDSTSPKDQPQAETKPGPQKSTLPWRNSTLLFDQSVTSQTLGIGGVPQSYVPVYEWWISFRPRYYITEKLFVWARLDFYKEFTNSDNGRAQFREDSFGDAWANLVYETPVGHSENTKVSVGARFRLPLSKASQAEGTYVRSGATAGISHKVPLHAADAPFLNDVHFRTGIWYEHLFSQSTTPVDTSFSYPRQDTEGHSSVSNQLSGSTLVNHFVLLSGEAAVQITPKLDFTFDAILLNEWHYTPTGNVTIPVAGGTTNVPRASDDRQFVQDSWLIASVNYDILEEMSLGLGYMNLQNVLAPDGQHRTLFGSDNFFWSPDARIFFDITANLDAIYGRVGGSRASTRRGAERARVDQIRLQRGL